MGPAGLVHGNRGRVTPRRLDATTKECILELVAGIYAAARHEPQAALARLVNAALHDAGSTVSSMQPRLSRSRRTAVDGRVAFAALALLLIAALIVGLFVVNRGGQSSETTVWGAITNQVRGGKVPMEAALQAFAYAYRVDIPGVRLPAGTDGRDGPTSGTGPMRWVQAHWAELTPDQRIVIDRYMTRGPADLVRTIGPGTSTSNGDRASTARAGVDLLAVARLPRLAPPPVNAGPASSVVAQFEEEVRQDIARIGLRLGLPIIEKGFVPGYENVDIVFSEIDGGNTLFTTFPCHGNDQSNLRRLCGSLSGFTPCNIVVWKNSWSGASGVSDLNHVLLTHEVVHCFQNTIWGDIETSVSAPAWITEGSALWLAADDTKTKGVVEPMVASQWGKNGWFGVPTRDLVDRTYDGYSYLSLLKKLGRNLWGEMAAAWRAAKGGDRSGAFIAVLNGDAADVRAAWAPSLLNQSEWNDPWVTDGYGLPAGFSAQQTDIVGTEDTSSVQMNGRNAVVHTVIASVGEIVLVTTDGLASVHALANGGPAFLGFGSKRLCVQGDCICPANTERKGERVADDDITMPFALALHGGPGGWSYNVSALKLDKECRKKPSPSGQPPPPKPCASDCAGSNGDPHLRTVDRKSYDFQAAGEFTLLRSPDGVVDVQVRQEPYRDRRSVSINTAVATRVNGHRVVISVGSPRLVVRIDGTVPVDPAAVDLGAGARLVSHPVGMEVELPDGTVLWALGLGTYGINVQVQPSDTLRAAGVGILGPVAPNAMGVPALPDGTVLPRTTDRHAYHQALYGRFADAWRITTSTTLFDYAAGKTTSDYTIAGFPAEEATQTLADLDPAQLALGQEACQAITDPVLDDQCVFDVGVTGERGFVRLYVATMGLVQRGPAALDEEPSPVASAASATPTPSGGQPPIEALMTGLKSVRGRAISPDGTVYLSVDYPDGRNEVLAVDAEHASVVRRTDAKGGGQVVFAAGSVWVAEFGGPTPCSVSRLDPATLTVSATIPTACTFSDTALAATDDGVWFQDPTGTDADGKGGHVRRIDPATNQIDRSVELPPSVLMGNLSSSPSTLFYKDFDAAWHRLLPGAAAFESMRQQAGVGIPVGDGFWTQANGADKPAEYFTDRGVAVRSVPIFGGLAGADEASVLAAGVDETDDRRALLRYPIDGSPPTVVAKAPAIGVGANQRTLDYAGAGPLLVTDRAVVAVWAAQPDAFASSPDLSLYVQWASLP